MVKKSKNIVDFQKPYFIGTEAKEVIKTISKKQLIGPSNYIEKCEKLLQKQLNCKKVLLANSGTDALEMACILAEFSSDDEVIIPSFNFPSSGTAVIRSGATPVFVDISNLDMNLTIDSIKKSITRKTKGIIIVHYAGISADILNIIDLAKRYNLIVIEDAAPAIYSQYKNQYLGTLGDFGVLSFHLTKNIFCGEGGALLINNSKNIDRAYIIREKGTNRHLFSKGFISKYTWVDNGSSFIPSSLQASFLYAQLKKGQFITNKRKYIFNLYHEFFINLNPKYNIQYPKIYKENIGNGHFYWILLPSKNRHKFIKIANFHGVELTTHYEPLHNSLAGEKYGKTYVDLSKTIVLASQLVRIPIHTEMNKSDVKKIIKKLEITIIECFN